MPRDVHARRAPGAEHELEPAPADVLEFGEHVADLDQDQLELLVRATRQKRHGARLPDDLPGDGTRR